MNLKALRAALRQRLFDEDPQKPGWTDPELDLYLNEAQNEACVRAELLLDSATPAVCHIAVVAGTPAYALHDLVLNVRRVELALQRGGLKWRDRETIERTIPGWKSINGEPCYFFVEERKLWLVPNPIADDTATIQVTRLPLEPMDEDGDEPEIEERLHYRLIDWAARCAYLKDDVDVMDHSAAERHEALFTRSFGIAPDANVQRKQSARVRQVTRMNPSW